jgi:hypothetical protein
MAARIGGELIANPAPGLGIDQRRVLARVKLTLVGNLTGVNSV